MTKPPNSKNIFSPEVALRDALMPLTTADIRSSGSLLGVCEILNCDQDAFHSADGVLICASHLEALREQRSQRFRGGRKPNP